MWMWFIMVAFISVHCVADFRRREKKSTKDIHDLLTEAHSQIERFVNRQILLSNRVVKQCLWQRKKVL